MFLLARMEMNTLSGDHEHHSRLLITVSTSKQTVVIQGCSLIIAHVIGYHMKSSYEAQSRLKSCLNVHAQNMVHLSIVASAFSAPSI